MAAGVLAELIGKGIWPANVRLTVVQPNARSPEKIRSQDSDRALDVEMWVDEGPVIPAVRGPRGPGARPTPWAPRCRFCPVAHACPALLSAAQAAARTQFDDAPEAQVIATRLDMAEKVILWAEAMKGYGLERDQGRRRGPGLGRSAHPPHAQVDRHRGGGKPVGGLRRPQARVEVPGASRKTGLKSHRIPGDWSSPMWESKSSGTKLARVDFRRCRLR